MPSLGRCLEALIDGGVLCTREAGIGNLEEGCWEGFDNDTRCVEYDKIRLRSSDEEM